MKHKHIKEDTNEMREGERYSLVGRITSSRNHGKILFMDLSDHTGKIQIVVEREKFRDAYEGIASLNAGSFISLSGIPERSKAGDLEIKATDIGILSKATLPLSPTPWEINALQPEHGDQVFDYPGFYLANPQRSAVLRIKTNFVTALHNYFQRSNFTLVEPPVLTDKLLYESTNAINVDVHNEHVFLSQCATFELEALAMVFGKVYTISPAFRNELSGSKRHLAEYSHAKAEVLLANLDDLMHLAENSLIESLNETVLNSQHELNKVLKKKIDFNRLDPSRFKHLTYDEALAYTQSKGSTTPYGHGLTRRDELILGEYVDHNYLWVHSPPFASEGFPYRRDPKQPHLAMVCDLIAPHGAGEMVGVAEKTTDADEIIQNLKDKGKADKIRDYWQYILLRKYGMPPHGGIGAAPERIIYGLLGLDHIRLTKPWPRYSDRNINQRHMPLNPWKDADIDDLIRRHGIE